MNIIITSIIIINYNNKMKTRSQTIIEQNQLVFDIDFDEASRLWNANKKKLPNGCFMYVCGAITKNGNFCKNKSCAKHKQYQHNFE